MALDAISARKQNQEHDNARQADRRRRITSVIPIIGMTSEGYLVMKGPTGTIYAELFNPAKFDLDRLTVEEAEQVESAAWSMMRLYRKPVKEIFLNFPENNQVQQRYFRKVIERTRNPVLLQMLEQELDTLVAIEKTYRKRASWIMIYGKSVTELANNIDDLVTHNPLYKLKQCSVKEKKTMLSIMNNPGVSVSEEE